MNAPFPTSGGLDAAGRPARQAVAACYGAAGLTVFACDPVTKRPRAAGWRTLDRATGQAQFERWPQSMVGLDTEQHRIVVVDCDNKNGKNGPIAFRIVCAQAGISLTGVPNVRTPSGGEHFFFREIDGELAKSTVDKIALGVDTRAKGGFVIAPGSVRQDGGVYQPVHPANLDEFIARIADPASLPPFPKALAVLVGLASPRAARAPQTEVWPDFLPPTRPLGGTTPRMVAAFLAQRATGPCELSAGIIKRARAELATASVAGMALARAGKLKERGPWRDWVLFAFTAFAIDWPELEAEAKAAYDEVCAASVGANTADNESQWDKTLAAARGSGQARFTIELLRLPVA